MNCSRLESGPITIRPFDGSLWLGGQGELGMETRFYCLCFLGLPSRNGVHMGVAALYTFKRRKPIENVGIGR